MKSKLTVVAFLLAAQMASFSNALGQEKADQNKAAIANNVQVLNAEADRVQNNAGNLIGIAIFEAAGAFTIASVAYFAEAPLPPTIKKAFYGVSVATGLYGTFQYLKGEWYREKAVNMSLVKTLPTESSSSCTSAIKASPPAK